MKKYLLNGQWHLSGNGYEVNGQIPGSVYSFLYLDNSLLPDPHYRDNEDLYLALADHEYTFAKVFSFTPNGRAVSLIFEGLDTLCTVYLNGHKIADTDNMHVRYTFDVSDVLANGETICRSFAIPSPPILKKKTPKPNYSAQTIVWRVIHTLEKRIV